MDSKALLAEALRLSPEERAALAGELLQSLDTEVDADAERSPESRCFGCNSQVQVGTAERGARLGEQPTQGRPGLELPRRRMCQ